MPEGVESGEPIDGDEHLDQPETLSPAESIVKKLDLDEDIDGPMDEQDQEQRNKYRQLNNERTVTHNRELAQEIVDSDSEIIGLARLDTRKAYWQYDKTDIELRERQLSAVPGELKPYETVHKPSRLIYGERTVHNPEYHFDHKTRELDKDNDAFRWIPENALNALEKYFRWKYEGVMGDRIEITEHNLHGPTMDCLRESGLLSAEDFRAIEESVARGDKVTMRTFTTTTKGYNHSLDRSGERYFGLTLDRRIGAVYVWATERRTEPSTAETVV